MKGIFNFAIAAALAAVMTTGCSGSDGGTLCGEFSVSATKKVRFAQGNLLYDPATKSYSFADNQLVVLSIGKKPPTKGDGITDRFAWGNPDDPYKTADTFADWGGKPIVNGGNAAGKWRTLSADEWEYIIFKRADSKRLVTLATVGSVKGMLLLPDDWCAPDGLAVKTIPVDSLRRSNSIYGPKSTDKTDYTLLNVYTREQWKILEDYGALFLPFTMMDTVGGVVYYSGGYWTTGGGYASFGPRQIWPRRGCDVDAFRNFVRLAMDVGM